VRARGNELIPPRLRGGQGGALSLLRRHFRPNRDCRDLPTSEMPDDRVAIRTGSNASEMTIGWSTNLWRAEMRRREFIAGVGSAAAWPLTARGQSARPVRRVGVLSPYSESDRQRGAEISAFVRGLAELGWTDGQNLQMDVRWAAGDPDRVRSYAKEIVSLQPDVILVDSTLQTAALQRETQTIPIIFVTVSDPVGSGFIASLSRPGGNITGFVPWEPSLGGKWVQLLAEIAPGINRVAALFNPETAPYTGSIAD
jgi:putative tryptophan/tyrosine transport system substrate-binding protein